ncbi:MAG: hypothetical protein NZM42_08795 [Gemmatales bacterium]|nr:hypothetical protein [Gemmatales bacterium]MDW8223088.1 hypothetical protein [Gemmatales bacterium]
MWHIGIDEAGYGPILGPFVMTAVALSSSRSWRADEIWNHLPQVSARWPKLGQRGTADNPPAFCITDSKQIHRGHHAFADLEYHTLPVLWAWLGKSRRCGPWLRRISVATLRGLQVPCYDIRHRRLPMAHDPSVIAQRAVLWREMLSAAGLTLLRPRVFIMLPEAINEAIAQHGTKAVLPLDGLRHLLPALLREISTSGVTLQFTSLTNTDDPVHCEAICDRLGGRLHYAAVLTGALDGWQLQTFHESAARCEYTLTSRNGTSLDGKSRLKLRLVIMPRAECRAFLVALASMISKYVREIFMLHWNDYWRRHVPDLRPTSGYPGDAPRFLHSIQSAYLRLGFQEAWLRRCR